MAAQNHAPIGDPELVESGQIRLMVLPSACKGIQKINRRGQIQGIQRRQAALKRAFSTSTFYWGWLRLLIGSIQMVSSVYAAYLLFAIGLQPQTLVLIGCSVGATGLSWLLYRGRSNPHLENLTREDSDTKS